MTLPPTPTERRLQALVAEKLEIDPDQVPLDRALLQDLGLDSFDAMAVLMEVERAFAPATLSVPPAQSLTTLRELAAYIDSQLVK